MERSRPAYGAALAAVAISSLLPIACVSDPVPQQFTVTNLGPAPIVHLSVTPLQSAPTNINTLSTPIRPFAQQPLTINNNRPQQSVYQVKAVYADGHTVTIPIWNIYNVPTLTIRYGQPQ